MDENKSSSRESNIIKREIIDTVYESAQLPPTTPNFCVSDSFSSKSIYNPTGSFVDEFTNKTTKAVPGASEPLTPELQLGRKTKSKTPRKKNRRRYVFSKPKKRRRRESPQLPVPERSITNEQILTNSKGNDSDCSSDTIILDDVTEDEDNCSPMSSVNSLSKDRVKSPELGKLLISEGMIDHSHQLTPDRKPASQFIGLKNKAGEASSKYKISPDLIDISPIKNEPEDISEDNHQQPISQPTETGSTFTSVKKTADAYITQNFLFSLLSSSQPTKRSKPQTARRGKRKQEPSSRTYGKEANENPVGESVASENAMNNSYNIQSPVSTVVVPNLVGNEFKSKQVKRKKPTKKSNSKKPSLVAEFEMKSDEINVYESKASTLVSDEMPKTKNSKAKSPKGTPTTKKKNSKSLPLQEFSLQVDTTVETKTPLKRKTPQKKSPKIKFLELPEALSIEPENNVNENENVHGTDLIKIPPKKKKTKRPQSKKKNCNILEEPTMLNTPVKDSTTLEAVEALYLKRKQASPIVPNAKRLSVDKNFIGYSPGVVNTLESHSVVPVKKELDDASCENIPSSYSQYKKVSSNTSSNTMHPHLTKLLNMSTVGNASNFQENIKYFDMSFEEDLSKKDDIEESLSLLSLLKKQSSKPIVSRERDSKGHFIKSKKTSKKRVTGSSRGMETTVLNNETALKHPYNPSYSDKSHQSIVTQQQQAKKDFTLKTSNDLNTFSSNLGVLKVKQEINDILIDNIEKQNEMESQSVVKSVSTISTTPTSVDNISFHNLAQNVLSSNRTVHSPHIPEQSVSYNSCSNIRIKQEPNVIETDMLLNKLSVEACSNNSSKIQKDVMHTSCASNDIADKSSNGVKQMCSFSTVRASESTTENAKNLFSNKDLELSKANFNQNSQLVNFPNLQIKKEPKDVTGQEVIILDSSDDEQAAVSRQLSANYASKCKIVTADTSNINIKKESNVVENEFIILNSDDDDTSFHSKGGIHNISPNASIPNVDIISPNLVNTTKTNEHSTSDKVDCKTPLNAVVALKQGVIDTDPMLENEKCDHAITTPSSSCVINSPHLDISLDIENDPKQNVFQTPPATNKAQPLSTSIDIASSESDCSPITFMGKSVANKDTTVYIKKEIEDNVSTYNSESPLFSKGPCDTSSKSLSQFIDKCTTYDTSQDIAFQSGILNSILTEKEAEFSSLGQNIPGSKQGIALNISSIKTEIVDEEYERRPSKSKKGLPHTFGSQSSLMSLNDFDSESSQSVADDMSFIDGVSQFIDNLKKVMANSDKQAKHPSSHINNPPDVDDNISNLSQHSNFGASSSSVSTDSDSISYTDSAVSEKTKHSKFGQEHSFKSPSNQESKTKSSQYNQKDAEHTSDGSSLVNAKVKSPKEKTESSDKSGVCLDYVASKLKDAANVLSNSFKNEGDAIPLEDFPVTDGEVECFHRLLVASTTPTLITAVPNENPLAIQADELFSGNMELPNPSLITAINNEIAFPIHSVPNETTSPLQADELPSVNKELPLPSLMLARTHNTAFSMQSEMSPCNMELSNPISTGFAETPYQSNLPTNEAFIGNFQIQESCALQANTDLSSSTRLVASETLVNVQDMPATQLITDISCPDRFLSSGTVVDNSKLQDVGPIQESMDVSCHNQFLTNDTFNANPEIHKENVTQDVPNIDILKLHKLIETYRQNSSSHSNSEVSLVSNLSHSSEINSNSETSNLFSKAVDNHSEQESNPGKASSESFKLFDLISNLRKKSNRITENKRKEINAASMHNSPCQTNDNIRRQDSTYSNDRPYKTTNHFVDNSVSKSPSYLIEKGSYKLPEKLKKTDKEMSNVRDSFSPQYLSTNAPDKPTGAGILSFTNFSYNRGEIETQNSSQNMEHTPSANFSEFSLPSKELLYSVIQKTQTVSKHSDDFGSFVPYSHESNSAPKVVVESQIEVPNQVELLNFISHEQVSQPTERSVTNADCSGSKSEVASFLQALSTVNNKNIASASALQDNTFSESARMGSVSKNALEKIDVPVNELLKILQTASNLASEPKDTMQASSEIKDDYYCRHKIFTQDPTYRTHGFSSEDFSDKGHFSESYEMDNSLHPGHSTLSRTPIIREYDHKSPVVFDNKFKHPSSEIPKRLSNVLGTSEIVQIPSQYDNESESDVDNEFINNDSDLPDESNSKETDSTAFINNGSNKQTDSTADINDGSNKEIDSENKESFPQYKSRWERIMERKNLEGQTESKGKDNHLLKDYFPVKSLKDKPKGPKPIAKVQPCSQSLPEKPILKEYKIIYLSKFKKMGRNILGKHGQCKVGRGRLGKRSQNKLKKAVKSRNKGSSRRLPIKIKENKMYSNYQDVSLMKESVKKYKISSANVKEVRPIEKIKSRKTSLDSPKLNIKEKKVSCGNKDTFNKSQDKHSKTSTNVKEKFKPHKALLDTSTLFAPDKVIKKIDSKQSKTTKTEKDSSSTRLYGRVTNRGSFLTQSSLNQLPKPKKSLTKRNNDKEKNTKFLTDELHSMVKTPEIKIMPESSIPKLPTKLSIESYKEKKKATFFNELNPPIAFVNELNPPPSPRFEYNSPNPSLWQRPVTPSDVTFQETSDSSEILSPPDSFSTAPYGSAVSKSEEKQGNAQRLPYEKTTMLSNIHPLHSSLFPKKQMLLPDPIPKVSSKQLSSNIPAFCTSSLAKTFCDPKDSPKEEFWSRPQAFPPNDSRQLPSNASRVETVSSKLQPLPKTELHSLTNKPRTFTPPSPLLSVPPNPNRSQQHKHSRPRQSKCICLPSKLLKASVGRTVFETSNVLLLILEWNVDWLIQQQKNHDPPPISAVTRKVVNTYDDIKDYYNTYFPLLLLETWQRIYVSWTHLHQASPYFCDITSYKVEKHSINVECQTVFKFSDAERGLFPEAGNVIMIKFGTKEKGGIKILGYITNVKVKAFDPSNDPQDTCYRTLKYTAGEILQRLTITFVGAYTSDDFDQNQLIRIQVLCNINSTLKQNDALVNVQNSPLYKNVMNPLTDGLRTVTVVARSADVSNMNDKICECVRDIMKGILSPHPLPLLTIAKALPSSDRLLVLPPLIEKMKDSYNSKVLLCTRTTKALTDIGFSLIATTVKVVIIGKRADVHQKLRKYLLEDLATDKVNTTFGEQMLNSSLLDESTKCEALENAKKEVLRECNVILCLIRNCHTDFIKQVCSEDDGIARMCGIIDEANLCTEPEIQIPLLYGISKLILIGDPDVPAKVCSKAAINYDYNRSLFHRAYELDLDSDSMF